MFPRPHEKEVDIVFPNLLILFIKKSFVGFKWGMILSCAVAAMIGDEVTE